MFNQHNLTCLTCNKINNNYFFSNATHKKIRKIFFDFLIQSQTLESFSETLKRGNVRKKQDLSKKYLKTTDDFETSVFYQKLSKQNSCTTPRTGTHQIERSLVVFILRN